VCVCVCVLNYATYCICLCIILVFYFMNFVFLLTYALEFLNTSFVAIIVPEYLLNIFLKTPTICG